VWSDEWLEARRAEIKPTTYMSYRGLLDKHLLPAFGRSAMARIRPLDIQRFLGTMSDGGLSRSRLRQARGLLSMILNAAVDNGYIGRDPVPRERLKGTEAKRDQRPLTFARLASPAERHRAHRHRELGQLRAVHLSGGVDVCMPRGMAPAVLGEPRLGRPAQGS
jgi:hypothetical protein